MLPSSGGCACCGGCAHAVEAASIRNGRAVATARRSHPINACPARHRMSKRRKTRVLEWSSLCTNAGGRRREDVMKLRASLLGILLVTATLPAGAGEKLTLKVSPAVAFAPANLI